MTSWIVRRRARKAATGCLHHAHHCRRMREDVAAPELISALDAAIAALRSAIRDGDADTMETRTREAMTAAERVMPPAGMGWLRENVEVLVVAIAVAMAFRTYFLQPFKIPTGSMQPTLYGITSVARAQPAWSDRLSFKAFKWILTGDWYEAVRVRGGGVMGHIEEDPFDPSSVRVHIGGYRYRLPVDAVRRGELAAYPGQYVSAGTTLWAGLRRAGDHVFVDKIRWNFVPPQRGEVIVFSTHGIPALTDGSHYIKRLCGLPGETVSIDPPDLLIDGQPVHEPASIERVVSRAAAAGSDERYDGYQLVDPRVQEEGFLRTPGDRFALGPAEYFAMGDNTGNSRDGRYWGAVPRRNLLGPAVVVYWPLGPRWGLVH